MLLLFADDVVLLTSDFIKLKEVFTLFSTFCVDNALTTSGSKTKLLVVGDERPDFKRGCLV